MAIAGKNIWFKGQILHCRLSRELIILNEKFFEVEICKKTLIFLIFTICVTFIDVCSNILSSFQWELTAFPYSPISIYTDIEICLKHRQIIRTQRESLSCDSMNFFRCVFDSSIFHFVRFLLAFLYFSCTGVKLIL